jgi:hypothetical protein
LRCRWMGAVHCIRAGEARRRARERSRERSGSGGAHRSRRAKKPHLLPRKRRQRPMMVNRGRATAVDPATRRSRRRRSRRSRNQKRWSRNGTRTWGVLVPLGPGKPELKQPWSDPAPLQRPRLATINLARHHAGRSSRPEPPPQAALNGADRQTPPPLCTGPRGQGPPSSPPEMAPLAYKSDADKSAVPPEGSTWNNSAPLPRMFEIGS